MEYNLSTWTSFFTAASPAVGALLGLMVTAATVRLASIESNTDTSYRLFLALSVLFFVLVYTLLPLVPLGRIADGILLTIASADTVGLFIVFLKESSSSLSNRLGCIGWTYAIGPISMLVSGISLIARFGGGLYWAIPGLMFTLAWALTIVWQFIGIRNPLESILPSISEDPSDSDSGQNAQP